MEDPVSTPGYTQYGDRPPQGIPQAGVPAQPAAPAQPAPQGYSTAPQGFVQGYVPVPQGPVKVRVNCVSLVCGICVWVLIALLVLDAWRMTHSPDVSASEADIGGFYPLFVMCFGGPLNFIGATVGSSRAKEKPAKWKLNRLGVILNLSPYVIFFVIMFVTMVTMIVEMVAMIVEPFLS